MKIEREALGQTAGGIAVDRYTLANSHGLTARIMTYGATLTGLDTADRHGRMANITLCLDRLEDYLAGHPFLGSIAGRSANRIGGAKFSLDGQEYRLDPNTPPNHLHGGARGFDKHVWRAEVVEQAVQASLRLAHDSPDGDQGYPGRLQAMVTYTVNDDNELRIDYTATTDRATPVNLTNHAYWNLAGAGSGSVLAHRLMLNADFYLPIGDGLVPTGEIRSVRDTPMDFTRPELIGARISQVPPGYDHCYVVNKRQYGELALAARVVEQTSGRVMEVFTTEPGVQLYTGNYLSERFTSGGRPFARHDGFCLETQHFPDTPNRAYFPSTILRPGAVYRQLTIHRFGVEA